MSANIAIQLLRGSVAINEMTKDINDVLELLTGYLDRYDCIDATSEGGFNINREVMFQGGNKGHEVRWNLGRIHRGEKNELYFYAAVPTWDGWGQVYHSRNQRVPATARVQDLHDSLDFLVRKLMERYGRFHDLFKPFLKAGE